MKRLFNPKTQNAHHVPKLLLVLLLLLLWLDFYAKTNEKFERTYANDQDKGWSDPVTRDSGPSPVL